MQKFTVIEDRDKEPFVKRVNALKSDGYRMIASGQSGTCYREQFYWAHMEKKDA